MNAIEILEQVRDTLTVRRIFGEPIERDGVLAIPVACVRGGFGGGAGEGQSKRAGEKAPTGWGGGEAFRRIIANRPTIRGQDSRLSPRGVTAGQRLGAQFELTAPRVTA